MPNPPKTLTEKELQEVEVLAGMGMRYEDIASVKGMCLDTLKKYASPELERGKAKARAAVMRTAYKMATSGRNPAMTMFWLKTQCGWRETTDVSVSVQPPPRVILALPDNGRCAPGYGHITEKDEVTNEYH